MTLLYLRAAVPAETPLREGVCAVGHETEPVSTGEAVRRIAVMPKPLGCYATVVGDLLTVEFRLPEQWRKGLLAHEPLDAHERLQDEWYVERYGADYRARFVLCVGRGEWQLATFGELAEWRRTYPYLGSGGWAGDDLGDAAARSAIPVDALAAATERGAVYIERYGPNEADDGVTGRIWVSRLELGPRSAIRCERCGERLGQYAVHWFENEHPTRSLCQRCVDEELTVSQWTQARDLDRQRADFLVAERTKSRAELAEMAEEQAMWWALRHQPPFVRGFIARYRAG